MKKPIAIQLYSLRELAQNDFPKLLEAVAQIGYQGVEFAGLHDHDPKEIACLIETLGLTPVAAHVPVPTQANIAEIVNDAQTIGYKTILTGFAPDDMSSPETLQNCVKKFQAAVELAQKYQLTLALHNHWWEFDHQIEGQTPYDILLKQIPDLKSELDTYWAVKAGQNPADILKKWAPRIPLIHVKDGDFNEKLTHLAVGQGKMKFNDILNAYDPNVVEWLIVELDNCDTDMLTAVKESYQWLTQNNYCTTK